MIRRIPYPLPAKREKPKSGIARAPQRIWPRHRRFVKSHRCCVPGCPALLVDPAHLRSVVFDGTGLTPFDWFLVALCRSHHEEEEACGPDAFGDRHGIDLWAIAAELARRSPDTSMRLAYLEWEADQYPEIRTPLARDQNDKATPSYRNRVEASRGEDVRPAPLPFEIDISRQCLSAIQTAAEAFFIREQKVQRFETARKKEGLITISEGLWYIRKEGINELAYYNYFWFRTGSWIRFELDGLAGSFLDINKVAKWALQQRDYERQSALITATPLLLPPFIKEEGVAA